MPDFKVVSDYSCDHGWYWNYFDGSDLLTLWAQGTMFDKVRNPVKGFSKDCHCFEFFLGEPKGSTAEDAGIFSHLLNFKIKSIFQLRITGYIPIGYGVISFLRREAVSYYG